MKRVSFIIIILLFCFISTVSANECYVGKILGFGEYEQDNDITNGPETILWQVIAMENNRALVISRYTLDAVEYHHEFVDITWETSSLRKWLNEEFYNNVFNTSEKGWIEQVTLQNPNNPDYGTFGGNPTQDRVFLLSIAEVRQYLPTNEARQCDVTKFAAANGAWTGVFDDHSTWALRSPGWDNRGIAYVQQDGKVDTNGGNCGAYCFGWGLRPSLWIDSTGVTTAGSLMPR